MRHPPKYYGTVEETSQGCYCKKNRGTVWFWTPRTNWGMKGMAAHTKCFRRLWKD